MMYQCSNKRPFIYTVAKDKRMLMEKFGCSRSMISEALTFRFNSVKHRKIRMYALNELNCTPINIKFK
jgi:hypothetical protein